MGGARDCAACHMSGYDARTGVFELLPISRGLRHVISESRPMRDIPCAERRRRKLLGMSGMRRSLKVAYGETSTEEVFRAIPTEHLIAEE